MNIVIQPGQTQYVRCRNGLVRGRCNTPECVVVTWSSGFVQSMKAESWDARVFAERPEAVRPEPDVAGAEAFFARQPRWNMASQP